MRAVLSAVGLLLLVPFPTVAETVPPEERPVEEVELDVFAYLRLEGSLVADDPAVAFVGRNDGFRLQNARVGLRGRYRDRLTLQISGDGAVDDRDAPNDVEGTLRFALKDAFVDVHLHQRLDLRVARFKPVFDIEEMTRPVDRGFVDRALESRGVLANDGFEAPGLGVGRSQGLALRSDALIEAGAFHLGFELAAQNGNGELDAVNDNDSLAYSAALLGSMEDRVLLWAAGRFNRRTEGTLPFRRTEDDLAVATGVRIVLAPVRFTAQFIGQRTDFPTVGSPHENAFGGHAEALIAIPGLEILELGYRYAVLDPSDLIPSDRVQEHTAGVNLAIPAYRLLLQVNYTFALEESGRKLDNDRAEAVIEVAL